ncbi:MAG TPA: DoxX family protein, partial [Sphingomonadales bacterium]|nr:DoxX family protein [Sphingomonadales bacterium]
MTPPTAVAAAADSPSALAGKGIRLLERIPFAAISLMARIGIAGVFWRSGQTKVEGWSITDSTFYLFEEEYRVPLLPPDTAAYMATIAEHLFPVLLVVGLASRLSALALLSM